MADADPIARARLLEVARDLVAHGRAGTTPLADDVLELPADRYTDPERFERERRLLFRRVPLLLAAGCELPAAGDHTAMEVAGVPVVLVRGGDGAVRAFLCSTPISTSTTCPSCIGTPSGRM